MGSGNSKPAAELPPNQIVDKSADVAKAMLKNVDTIIKCASLVNPELAVLEAPLKLMVVVLEAMGLDLDDKLDMEKIMEGCRKVIREELTKLQLDQLEAWIIGARQWLNVEYRAYAKKWSHQRLYEELKEKMDNFYDKVITLLTHKRFCATRTGLPLFVVAAQMHLNMIHDLAILDPEHKGKPLKSPHAEVLADRAKIYSDYVSDITEKLVKERTDKVSFDQCKTNDHPLYMADPDDLSALPDRWEYEDGWYDAETESSWYGDDASVDARKETVEKELLSRLGHPTQTISSWQEMHSKLKRNIRVIK